MDGAMGTMLQRYLKLGENPMSLNIEQPEAVEAVHRAYLDAGAQILCTNTFGANERKLKGTGYTPEQVIGAAVAAAKRASDGKALVALDVGPIGELLEPMGTLSFDTAYALFRRQMVAGERAGADLIAIETMSDLGEVRAALLAAREQTALPVMVTMTFEPSGRSFTGCLPESLALTAEGLGAVAVGVNCSLGPAAMRPIAAAIGAVTHLPVILKPNAGLPDPVTGEYRLDPETFAAEMAASAADGVTIMGGCCGTRPAYIAALKKALEKVTPVRRTPPVRAAVCSATRYVPIDGVQVIGERINPTGKKRFQQALLDGNMDYVITQATQQAAAGAAILDVNVGIPGIDEPEMMRRAVQAIQSVCDLPLQIDSSNPEALEQGLRHFSGKAIINSVSGKEETLSAVLPLAARYGAAVVGLTLDDGGIPEKAEDRLRIAEKILARATDCGIPREDVYIDCLTLTVSAQQDAAAETLRAIRMVKERLGLKTLLGVSNISFGLPARGRINSYFLTMAMEAGLDLPILNPNAAEMMDAIAVYDLISGRDRGGAAHIARFADAAAPTAAPEAQTHDILYALTNGLSAEAARIAGDLLDGKSELAIIEEDLIPALDEVGRRYESGALFLPQLLNAASAAGAAFDVVKAQMTRRGGASADRGTIVVATVEGDIHDIGKNIVKTILENYGYRVIDLGKDVPPQMIVERALRENVRLVGLSALMTTTLPSMAATISALRAAGPDCRIMVGGAVLTPDYAAEIGADFYAKDARASVEIAREVFGK